MEVEELTNEAKELGRINEKQEIRVRFYETWAHILAIVYIFFQGVFLVSISLPSASNQCKRWWVTFTASPLSSLIFFLAFIDTVNKLYYTQYHLDMNYVELNIINKQIREIRYGHSMNIGDSSSSTSTPQKPFQVKLKPDVVQLFKRKVYIIVILLALIAFTVIVLFACRSLLCNDDSKVSVSHSLSPCR